MPFLNMYSDDPGTLNAARNESFWNYCPEASRKVSTSEYCAETATNSSLTLPKLQFDIEQEFVTYDVGGASSRNCQSKNMDCDGPSDGGTNDERTKYLFGAAGFFSKVVSHGNRKLAEKPLQFLS